MAKKTIRVVGAVIEDDNNNILCAQRPEGKNLALKWEFPGGKIEDGETPVEALKRELVEEMTLDISICEKITTTVYEYDFGIVELTTYYAKIISGEIQLLEHVQMKWVNPVEIEKLDWAPADIPAIEIIKQKSGNRVGKVN
ncbi:MAG: (deoxy)nucleoside triphosphate pyrophosphohydrolase [Jeotgalicoccus sp.]